MTLSNKKCALGIKQTLSIIKLSITSVVMLSVANVKYIMPGLVMLNGIIVNVVAHVSVLTLSAFFTCLVVHA
jgi:hypothetical protein